MDSVAASGSESNIRAFRVGVGSKGVPNIDFTSSGSRDCMAGNLVMQSTHTIGRSNQRHVPSFHQSTVDFSVPSITVFSSLSRCCDLHVHDYFSERWQIPSMWFSTAHFARRPVVSDCSLGSVQKLRRVLNCIDPHCVCQTLPCSQVLTIGGQLGMIPTMTHGRPTLTLQLR